MTLEVLVENYAPLDAKKHLFLEHKISKKTSIISVLGQVLRKFVLHLLHSYLQILFQ